MRTRCGLVTTLAALTLTMGAVCAPAAAQEPGGLRVSSVDGRAVSFEMALPPEVVIDATTELKGVVEIDGRVVPATVTAPVLADQAPRAVVLVLDASGSMAGASMASARRAARAYLADLPGDVQAGLVTFADRVSVLAAPGADHAEMASVLADVTPDGETSLFDGVAAAVDVLPPGAEGRLVVLTDGQDTVSALSLAQAVRSAADADVVVDVILLDPSDADRQVASALAVGGSVTTARTAADLVRHFEQAAAQWAPFVRVRAVVPVDLDASGAAAVVTVSAGGVVIEESTILPLAVSLSVRDAQSPTQGAVPAAPAGQPSLAPALIGAGAGIALVLLAVWAVVSVRAGRMRRDRIAQVLAYSSGPGGVTPGAADPAFAPMWSRLSRQYALSAGGRRLDARLAAAEIPLSPTMWRVLEGSALVPLMLALWLLVGQIWLALLLTLVLVPLIFGSILRVRVSRRQRAFSDELPEFLLLLSSALRAGLSFSQSLESAANQHRGQVGRQIRRALAEAQLSSRLDDALLSCADRMGNDDLKWTVTALSVQREVGGNLSSILDSAAATIKGRHALAREVRTLSAEGRLSAYVLIALPLGVLAFLVLFRREYVSQLWSHPLGIAMMVALVILLVVGWVWMRAIVRIRV